MAEQHTLQLDEEEQLQLALALSAEEARQQGHTVSSTDDEALARQLQVRLVKCRRRCLQVTSRILGANASSDL